MYWLSKKDYAAFQIFIDIMLKEFESKEIKIDVTSELDLKRMQKIINSWINEWKKFNSDETFDKLKKEYSSNFSKAAKRIKEKEFWRLWLNYSPKEIK